MKKKQMLPLLLVMTMMILSATAGWAAGAYENALTDLRSAHWLIDSHPADWKKAPDETAAKNEIVAAIGEIKKAGIDDGKEMKDHPLSIERIADRKGRLMKANDLLKQTQTVIGKMTEDDAKKKQLKASSLNHLTEAIKNIDKLIAASK